MDPYLKRRGFLATGRDIVKRETPLGLYKGLGAVITGIVPKMATRFTSYEWYKQKLAGKTTGAVSGQATFLGENLLNSPLPLPRNLTYSPFSYAAGLAAGVTEAIVVVTPMEVIKIRLQAQHHSMADPLDIPKYRNAAHATYTVVKEEGFGALYRGVTLTALRQGSNQAVNFSAYSALKTWLQTLQMRPGTGTGTGTDLPSWQTMLIGLLSGAMGPLSNAPIDTIKTRLQKTPSAAGDTPLRRIAAIAADMWRQEGTRAFYKGITPRVMRVAPGQAVTFTVYEALKTWLEGRKGEMVSGVYEE